MRTVGMVIFPDLTQLDLTGPYEVFGRLPDLKVILVAGVLHPIKSDHGLLLTPDYSFADSPQLDILFVPGGNGVFEAMQNKNLIDFLQKQAEKAEFITSVCTGSLILAAAGLLNGYCATTHWLSINLLKLFDVQVIEQRVVIDRNRITGGGVTAGIDFGLSIASKLFGEKIAQEIQLMMEYNPDPPFHSGSPKTADKEIVEKAIENRKEIQQERENIIKEILLFKRHSFPKPLARQGLH
jgi:cyclohexyl-isocyanide hydratase